MPRRTTVLAVVGVLVLGLVVWVFPVVRDAAKAGFLDRPLSETYRADRELNLRALHTALLQYHDSEDRFPLATGWEAAIEDRLRPANMSMDDARKKLSRPDLTGLAPGSGYALNRAAAGKYRDDIGGGTTVLVYESRQRSPGSSGDPSIDMEGKGITLEGKVVSRKNGP